MAQMQVNGVTAPLQQTNTNIKCLYVTHTFGLVNDSIFCYIDYYSRSTNIIPYF